MILNDRNGLMLMINDINEKLVFSKYYNKHNYIVGQVPSPMEQTSSTPLKWKWISVPLDFKPFWLDTKPLNLSSQLSYRSFIYF